MAGNYAQLYSKYTDEQLLELAAQRDTLLDPGKLALDDEMKRRGFDPHERMTPVPEVAVTTPDTSSGSKSILIFAPIGGFYALWGFLMIDPAVSKNPIFLVLIFFYFFFTSPFGSFWMLYQSIRFESKPTKYILLSFVPYAFLWYYFERARNRTHIGRVPVSLR